MSPTNAQKRLKQAPKQAPVQSRTGEEKLPVFESVLFEQTGTPLHNEAPDCFGDLNLDQVAAALCEGRQDYDLAPIFYTPLSDIEAVRYRQEVMQDLAAPALVSGMEAFTAAMAKMRHERDHAAKLSYRHEKDRVVLDAAELYAEAVLSLKTCLDQASLRSRGFKALQAYLANYLTSPAFRAFQAETKTLLADLDKVSYCLLIKGDSIAVRRYQGETDYSAEVTRTFAKFRQAPVADYRPDFAERANMDHVEAKILDFVAALYPDIFARLDAYCTTYRCVTDAALMRFEQELQFYLAYRHLMTRAESLGLRFCIPALAATTREVASTASFDLALALKRHRTSQEAESTGQTAIVPNDFELNGKERILVVTGPNQGGKTTFARTFGQIHYLAALGLPVPGDNARLVLFDHLLTHFGKEEDIATLSGKLQDDLVRIHDILDLATSKSVVIINELFASTTLQDASLLGQKIMGRLIARGVIGVWVTFLDELSAFSAATVSMISTVPPDDPTRRTYRIVRQPANGRSYALSLAEKYRLTYQAIKARLRP